MKSKNELSTMISKCYAMRPPSPLVEHAIAPRIRLFLVLREVLAELGVLFIRKE